MFSGRIIQSSFPSYPGLQHDHDGTRHVDTLEGYGSVDWEASKSELGSMCYRPESKIELFRLRLSEFKLLRALHLAQLVMFILNLPYLLHHEATFYSQKLNKGNRLSGITLSVPIP